MLMQFTSAFLADPGHFVYLYNAINESANGHMYLFHLQFKQIRLTHLHTSCWHTTCTPILRIMSLGKPAHSKQVILSFCCIVALYPTQDKYSLEGREGVLCKNHTAEIWHRNGPFLSAVPLVLTPLSYVSLFCQECIHACTKVCAKILPGNNYSQILHSWLNTL